jgi:hypothetical protein
MTAGLFLCQGTVAVTWSGLKYVGKDVDIDIARVPAETMKIAVNTANGKGVLCYQNVWHCGSAFTPQN